MWQDVAEFRHFGNIWKGFGICLRIYLALGKILNLLYQIGQIFVFVHEQNTFGHIDRHIDRHTKLVLNFI